MTEAEKLEKALDEACSLIDEGCPYSDFDWECGASQESIKYGTCINEASDIKECWKRYFLR